MRTRMIVAFASVALLVLGSAASAQADTTGVTHLNVQGGPLSLDTDPSGPQTTNVALTGAPQLVSVSLAPFGVTDATGTLNGWHVDVALSDFTNGAFRIDASAAHMAVPNVVGAAGASMTGVHAYGIEPGTGGGVIVRADQGQGAGIYLISPQPIELTVPADATPGTYQMVVNVSVTSGP